MADRDLIAEARELLFKATPGPWTPYRSKHVEIASGDPNADRLKMVAHVYKSGMAQILAIRAAGNTANTRRLVRRIRVIECHRCQSS